MIRTFCNDCDRKITSGNSTHRNGKGDFLLTGIFVSFSDGLHYCDACLLKKFTEALRA